VILYADTSVLLRKLFSSKGQLRQFSKAKKLVTSHFARVECLRSLDRLRINRAISEESVATKRFLAEALLESCERVEVSNDVLQRASEPFPTTLGSLDAIHLATALLWRDEMQKPLFFGTHDRELGRAAASMGFVVLGL
jgi:predicted nucleic acid-binding protein